MVHVHFCGISQSTHSISIFYLASPQGQGHHNSVSQLLWGRITYPPINYPCGWKSEYPEKTHHFRQSVDYTLFT